MRFFILCLFILSFFFSYSDIDDGLVAYYPFNGNADDESGNWLHADVYGADLCMDRFDNISSAYQFDGIDDFIENTTGLINITDQVSISFWIYKFGAFEDDYQKMILTGDGPTNYGINFSQGEAVTPFYFEINDDESLITTDYPSSDEWHHIVGVYDGSNVEFFIDKFSKVTNTCSGNVFPLSPLRIGWGYLSEFFQGNIDDIRIYNRVLSESEIEELFHLDGWRSMYNGLVAYYPFDGNTDDESGYENDGSVSGAALATDRFGNSNNAYYFDGIDDFIEIDDDSSLDIGFSDYSIVAWIKTANTINGRIFSKGSSQCVTGYTMRTSGSNNYAFLENAYDGTCQITLEGITEINDDEWHLVVGTVARDVGAKLYIDRNVDAITFLNTSSYDLSNDRNPTIGINDVAGNEPFEGIIDDVMIYDRALSDADIESLYFMDGWDNLSYKLSAYYPFNGNAYDESVNGNIGTVYGASLVPDRFDNVTSAYQFDGIDDYIDIQNYTLSIRENLSICFWAKNLDETFTDGNSNFVITKGSHLTPSWFDYVCSMSTSKEYVFSVVNNNNIYHVVSSPVLDDSYHFVVSIYDYDNSLIKIYLDGVLGQSLFVSGLIDDTNDEFFIGDFNGSSSVNFFNGMIDDIRIYERVLSETEIDELYASGGWMNNPENITIEIIADNIQISWDAVTGATSYKIYSYSDPYEPVENWTFEEEVTVTSWSEPLLTNEKKFYYVTANN